MLEENIKYLRIKHGLSQSQLGERLFTTRQTVSSWEKGTSIPDSKQLLELSKLFDVTMDRLMLENESLNSFTPNGKYIFSVEKIDEFGNIHIPESARSVFGIQPGDELILLGDIRQGLALVKNSQMMEFARQIISAQNKEKSES